MSPPKQRCVICEQSDDQSIILFTERILMKCRTILNVRKKHGLKYENVTLPTIPNDIEGYHTKCHNNFAAVMKKYYEPIEDITLKSSSGNSATQKEGGAPPEKAQHASKDTISQDPSQMCIFCDKKRKKQKGKDLLLHQCEISSLRDFEKFAQQENDLSMIQRFESKNSASDKVSYHIICRVNYQNQMKSSGMSKETPWHIGRLKYKKAFEELSVYIESTIIRDKKCVLFSSLCRMFREIFDKTEQDETSKEKLDKNDESFCEQHLEEKVKKKFPKQLKIISIRKRKAVIPADCVEVDNTIFETLEKIDILQTAATILKEDLMYLQRDELPDKLKMSDVKEGECSIPKSLHEFYLTLIGGMTCQRRSNSKILDMVNSLSQDVIYAFLQEKSKSSNYITLAEAVKKLMKNCGVIDNSEDQSESLSVNENDDVSNNEQKQASSTMPPRRRTSRRRNFQSISDNLPSHGKKPRMSDNLLQADKKKR